MNRLLLVKKADSTAPKPAITPLGQGDMNSRLNIGKVKTPFLPTWEVTG